MSQPVPLTETDRPVRLSAEARRDFAVLVPAFNEVDNMADLVRELRVTFERHGLEGEVLLIDDGSTDGTAERALSEAGGWPQFRVVQQRRNFGKTEAMVAGAEHTAARWVILFDADLQHTTEEIPRFLAKLDEGFDIVTGRKVGRYEKAAVSSIYNRLSRAIFEIPVSDTNSMKAFRRDILDEVRLRHDWHRFFVVLAYARGYTITEIDIALYPRRHGEAKYAGRGRILVGLLDLLSVWFFLFFSRKPMMLFGISGLVMAAAGVVVGLITIVLRLIEWVSPIGYRPLLYLVILLEVLGFLLFGFGFIAELVAQQYAEIDSLHRDVARLTRSDTVRAAATDPKDRQEIEPRPDDAHRQPSHHADGQPPDPAAGQPSDPAAGQPSDPAAGQPSDRDRTRGGRITRA